MTKQGRFAQLDGLRGLAALVVIAYHIEVKSGSATSVFSRGYVSVDLFFLLSGFVVALAYEEKLRAEMSFAKFVEVRLVRLFPIMVLAGLIAAVASAAGYYSVPFSALAAAAGIFFIPTFWRPGELYPYNGSEWSLFFEIVANIFYAIACRALTTKRLAVLVAILAVLQFAAAHHYGSLGVGWARHNVTGGLFRALFGFFAGVLIYRAWCAGATFGRTVWWAPFLAFLGVVFALPHIAGWYIDAVVVTLLFPAIIWVTVQSPMPSNAGSIALFWGAMSYPIYALQEPIRNFMSASTGNVLPQPWWLMSLTLVLPIGVAYLVMRYFDEPSRKAMSQLLRLGRIPSEKLSTAP